MRSIWLIFGCLLAVLLGLKFFLPQPADKPVTDSPPQLPAAVLVSERRASPLPGTGRRDSLVRFALRQAGTPYVYAGTSPLTGFDCSGFIAYVFGHFRVAMPHSTALLIGVGRPVPRAQAQPGDIVVFTGTADGSTTPGHAGIVLSAPGETPLRFVHASSATRESGVKISQIENSGYERRFLQVRRVLAGAPASPHSTELASLLPAGARPTRAVAPLPAIRPAVAIAPAAAPPAKLAALLAKRPRAATQQRPGRRVVNAVVNAKPAAATARKAPASAASPPKTAAHRQPAVGRDKRTGH